MYIFILNPVAGSGKAKKIFDDLIKTTVYQQMKKHLFITNYHGHTEILMSNVLAQFQLDDIKGLIVIGGDGTMHEVINALGETRVPITYIPGGSGNDFARGISGLLNPEEILRNTYYRPIAANYWLGKYQSDVMTNKRFVNCLGVGLDAAVAKRANKSKFKKIYNRLHLGKLVYAGILIRQLISFKPFAVQLSIDEKTMYFENCLFIVVNNHPYFGGGMKINPTAINSSENISVLVIDSISKWKVLALFGTVFTGKHLKYKEVHLMKGKSLIISTESLADLQADGETSSIRHLSITKDINPIKVCGTNVMAENNQSTSEKKVLEVK